MPCCCGGLNESTTGDREAGLRHPVVQDHQDFRRRRLAVPVIPDDLATIAGLKEERDRFASRHSSRCRPSLGFGMFG